MTDYKELIRQLKTYEDGYGLYDAAAAAIEDLEGFLSEAERDRDEYEERMRKEQERVIVLQAEVKRLVAEADAAYRH